MGIGGVERGSKITILYIVSVRFKIKKSFQVDL